jgi:flagellar hook-basal body complex protein FliE
MSIDTVQTGKSIESLAPKPGEVSAKPESSLGQAFEKIVDAASESLRQADEAAVKANTGGPVDLHDVMIAMEKADISLRLLVQVRNKAVDAYKEIMRMQV